MGPRAHGPWALGPWAMGLSPLLHRPWFNDGSAAGAAEDDSDGHNSDDDGQASTRTSRNSKVAMLPVLLYQLVTCKLCKTRCDEPSPVPVDRGVSTGGFIQWAKYSGLTSSHTPYSLS